MEENRMGPLSAEEEKQIALGILRDAIAYARVRGVCDAEMIMAITRTAAPTITDLKLLRAQVAGAVQ